MMRVICQFKIWTIIVLSLFVLSSKGQVYQVMPQYGYKFNRISTDSTLHIPSFCGVPNITDYIKNGMIAIDTCNNVLFQWTRLYGWTPISTGTYLDTTSLSNRINQRVKYTDTTAMLSPYLKKTDTLAMLSRYLRKSDTASLSNRINLKVNISDTSGMLSKYLRRSDTTTMLNPYLRKVDTASLSNRINLKQNILGKSYPIRINNDIVSIDKATYFSNGYIDSFQYRTFLNKVDSVYRKPGKDSIYISTNGTIYQIKDSIGGAGTLTRAVDTIQREAGKDSIIFTILGKRYAIKDSTGVGGATTRLITTVYNNSGATISKGSVVYINGRHSSNLPTIALAQANTEANSYSTFAMVQDDILNNNSGTVIQAGNISNLNLPTSTYTDGQLVYLSPSIAGGITTTKPLAPYHIVKIGTITRAHPTLGSIELKIENGWQLDELSDVKIASVPLDSTILQFSRVDSLWHDVNPTTAMGNRFVKSISRVPGKDSIIFYIGSTRYAIKDSIGGGGGGTPAGSNGYVQFNNSGSFGGNSNFSWNNSNERLGIGVPSPEVKLDVALGQKGGMPLNYEMASFQKNGYADLGVYTTGSYLNGAGSSIVLGNSMNTMDNKRYPAFELQNSNDSSINQGLLRYNYFERDSSGTVTNANIDLFNVYSNGTVQINPFSYGLSANPRLIIGEDNNGATLETPGNCYIGNGLNVYNGIISNGTFTTNFGVTKHITFWYDSIGGTDYYVETTDHIVIFKTTEDNGAVYLPSDPIEGQEIIVKQSGETTTYTLQVYGNGHDIWLGEITQGDVAVPDTVPHSITFIYSNGYWYVINY